MVFPGQGIWNLLLKCLFGFRTIIALRSQQAHFIFHLHRKDCVFLPIEFSDMGHQCGKCHGIFFNSALAEWRYRIYFLPGHFLHPEIVCGILFHPSRHIHGLAVLPQSEPEQNQMLPMLSRLSDDPVN